MERKMRLQEDTVNVPISLIKSKKQALKRD